MHEKRFIYVSLLSFLFLSLTACIGGTSPPSQFYLLEPIDESDRSIIGAAAMPVIALGPVRIPRYIDRPQIVTASGTNSYQLSELNRWAESLDENISRVLAQNLSLLAPVEVVPVRTSNRARQAHLRVSVNILEFHVDPQGQAGLTAQWRLSRGGVDLLSRQMSYRAQASTDDYAVMVAALNDCLNRMSREIAAAMLLILREDEASAQMLN